MTEMKKCIYCGRELEKDMIFCPRCGRPVPSENPEDRNSQTLIFNIKDLNIPQTPVMRNAKLVDTGVFPAINENTYPDLFSTPAKRTAEKKPEKEPEFFTRSVRPFGDLFDEPEAIKPAPQDIIPETPEDDDEDAIPLSSFLSEPGPVKDEQPTLEIKTAEPEPVKTEAPKAEETASSFSIPFIEAEPQKPAAPVSEPEKPAQETGEYDVLGDLQNVLKMMLADDDSVKEEDVLDGNTTRDTAPSDNSYDVPFILKQPRNEDEDTKAALKLAGLNPDEPEGSTFVNPLDAEEDTLDIAVPFDFDLPKKPAAPEQETVLYEQLLEQKPEAKLSDEGKTMVFSTVREEPEPVKEAVVEKQPEAEDLNIPKKPVKREIELTPAKKEPEEKDSDDNSGSSKENMIIIAALLLLAALVCGIWYFVLRDHRSTRPSSNTEPAAETAAADTAALPEETEAPVLTAAPETAAAETPAAAVDDDPTHFDTVARDFAQFYRAYLEGTNNGDMSSLSNVTDDLRTALQARVNGVNSGYRFSNRKIYIDRTTYELDPTADSDGYYLVKLYALAENDCTKLSDNSYIDNKPTIAASIRFNPETNDWYATAFQVIEAFSVEGHELVEVTE